MDISESGNRGERVRSDCFISLDITYTKGIEIELKSKVKSLYGRSIEKLTQEILAFFDIKGLKF